MWKALVSFRYADDTASTKSSRAKPAWRLVIR
jgi:hypothetical protein